MLSHIHRKRPDLRPKHRWPERPVTKCASCGGPSGGAKLCLRCVPSKQKNPDREQAMAKAKTFDDWCDAYALADEDPQAAAAEHCERTVAATSMQRAATWTAYNADLQRNWKAVLGPHPDDDSDYDDYCDRWRGDYMGAP